MTDETHRKLSETRRNTAEARLDEIEKLQAEVAKYKTALEFYADPSHWTIEWVEGSFGDYGDIARRALKE